MNEIVKIQDNVTRFLEALTEEKRTKIISDAINKGADIIHSASQRALSQISAGAAKLAPTIGLKKTNYKYAKVSLVGKKSEGIDYRLKWFERGTKERFRKRKNNGSTGTFRGYGFFKQARESSATMVESAIITSIDRAMKQFENN